MSLNSVLGGTSGIITNMAIIIGLNTLANAKISIIGSLLVVALADNISDTLGIHIYQESEGLSRKVVLMSSITNFFTRFLVSLGFIFIIYFFPINFAVTISIIYGLFILSIISYLISKKKGVNSLQAITEHIIIASVVMFLSRYFSNSIIKLFK
jgi:VIT1/CCC1 family predicted Fe2+/Mn2+ transporter